MQGVVDSIVICDYAGEILWNCNFTARRASLPMDQHFAELLEIWAKLPPPPPQSSQANRVVPLLGALGIYAVELLPRNRCLAVIGDAGGVVVVLFTKSAAFPGSVAPCPAVLQMCGAVCDAVRDEVGVSGGGGVAAAAAAAAGDDSSDDEDGAGGGAAAVAATSVLAVAGPSPPNAVAPAAVLRAVVPIGLRVMAMLTSRQEPLHLPMRTAKA